MADGWGDDGWGEGGWGNTVSSELVWIGNVGIPFLTSQDYSKQREVLERNFVGYSPQVFEFPSRLEQGTFSLLLLDGSHPQNLTLQEQRRALVSLPEYHATSNAFSLLEDQGWLSFNNVSTVREPTLMTIGAEVDVFYLENDDYQPAYLNNPSARADDLNLSSNPYVALNSEVTDVELRNSDTGTTTSVSKAFSYDATDYVLDFYSVDGRQLIYEHPSGTDDFTVPERTAIVRASDGSDSPFFSGYEDFIGASVNNAVLKAEDVSDGADLYYWDSEWVLIGTLEFPRDAPVLSEMDNHSATIEYDDGNAKLWRGEPYITFTGDFNEFRLDTSAGDDPITSTSTEGDYAIVGSGSNEEYFISRSANEGSFSPAGSTIVLDGISNDVTVSVGFKPVGLSRTEVLEWSQTDEAIERNLLARDTP